MRYLFVRWLHSLPDIPVELFSEIDADGYEVRKVEIYADGHKGYASPSESMRGTRLGELPVPEIEDIAADPEFAPALITKDEFEKIWANRFSAKISA